MATIDGSVLCRAGIPYPLATEIARQMNAGQGNPNMLCALGVNAGPAIELANQITTGTFSAHKLALAMWNPITAIALKTLGAGSGGGGGGPPNPFLGLNIVGVGDSISQNTYEDKLGVMTGRTMGVIASGGMTSSQVAARFGGIPISVSLTGTQIPASGAVALTACSPVPLNVNSFPQTMPCVLQGIPGTLTRTSGSDPSNTYTFTRTTSGSIVACPDSSVLAPTDVDYSAINIFWVGFNGWDVGWGDAAADTARMIAKCTGPFLVLSILNQGGSQYNASGAFSQNNEMLSAYGDWTTGGNYVDVRQYLVDHYNPALAQDVTDYGNGGSTSCVPTSLRQDFIHPDTAGQYLTAELLNRVLIAKGWALDTQPGLDTLFVPGIMQSGVVPTYGNVIGATPGSTIVTNISGLTLDSPTRTFTGTPSLPAGGIVANAWVETLAGQGGSPKSSPQAIVQAITDPGQLLIYNNSGTLFLPDSNNHVFSDFAGTTPAVMNGPVGRFTKNFGPLPSAGQQAIGKMPFLKVDGGGKRYLLFDGVDDLLSFGGSLYGSQVFTTIMTVKCLSDHGVAFIEAASAGNALIGVVWQGGRSPQGIFKIDNGANASVPIGGDAAGLDTNAHVLSVQRAGNTDRRLIVDKTVNYSYTAADGAMSVDSAVLGDNLTGGNAANMALYGICFIPGAFSDTDRGTVETYMGGLAGLSL